MMMMMIEESYDWNARREVFFLFKCIPSLDMTEDDGRGHF